MKIGKSDCLGFAILCIMIALKTLFVRHVMGITYEIAGLVPSLLNSRSKDKKILRYRHQKKSAKLKQGQNSRSSFFLSKQ